MNIIKNKYLVLISYILLYLSIFSPFIFSQGMPVGNDWSFPVFKYQLKNSRMVIALSEDSGLYINRKKVLVVGPGSAFIFTPKKEKIEPGFFIHLPGNIS